MNTTYLVYIFGDTDVGLLSWLTEKQNIHVSFQKAKSLDRSKLLNTKDTTEGTNIISCVTTLNPQNPEIYTDKIQLKYILHRNEALHQCFRNKTFLKSKRQPPNLKRLLTKAKFTMKQTEECSVRKCNEPRCDLCKYIREGSSVKVFQSKRKHVL